MKQHISVEQLAELSTSQFKKLMKCVEEKNLLPHFTAPQLMLHPTNKYLADCMSIGQMIELLQDSGDTWWKLEKHEINAHVGGVPDDYEGHFTWNSGKGSNTLADTLWEAVRKVLEE